MGIFSFFLDGLSILNLYRIPIAIFLVTLCGLGLLMLRAMRVDSNPLTAVDWLVSLGLGSPILALCAYLLALLAYYWHFLLLPGSYLIFVAAGFGILREFLVFRPRWRLDIIWLVMTLAGFFLLVIRLAFLTRIIVPPYSDSPIHYRVIAELLHPETVLEGKLSFGNLLNSYYHFGYHGLVVWLSSASGIDPINTMTLVPLVFLVIAASAVFFLTFVLTKDLTGAAFAGLLASIGWMMPAYAVNWGKFPALLAIAVFPAVAASWLYFYQKPLNRKYLFWGTVLILGAVLIHTRIAICLALAAGSYILAGKFRYENQSGFAQSLRVALFFGLFLWAFLRFWGEYYQGLPVWLALAVLIPFGFWEFPRPLAAIFFYLAGLWGGMVIPLPGQQTLLDRQFLDMMLYIPFSVIAGLGLTGLLRRMPRALSQKPVMRLGIPLVVFCLVIFSFVPKSSLLPNPCCNYFTEDDRLAFEWMKANASEHTLFIISAFYDGQQKYGTDAGIWIYPLTGHGVNTLQYNTDWDSASFPAAICHFGAGQTYLYRGDAIFSFIDNQLARQKWLRVAYQQGDVKVYEVNGCAR